MFGGDLRRDAVSLPSALTIDVSTRAARRRSTRTGEIDVNEICVQLKRMLHRRVLLIGFNAPYLRVIRSSADELRA